MSTIYNFCQVSDTLACSGQPTEEQLKELAAEKYAIVNLAMPNTKYSLPDEAASAKALGMDYYHLPVVFDNPQVEELEDFITWMNRHTDTKVMVHCVANYRASVFTGLYLFAIDKLNENETRLFIEEIWQPDPIWEQFLDESLEYIKSSK